MSCCFFFNKASLVVFYYYFQSGNHIFIFCRIYFFYDMVTSVGILGETGSLIISLVIFLCFFFLFFFFL